MFRFEEVTHLYADEGDIIFQAKCKVEKTDSPQDIAQKIHKLEHLHLPIITEKLVCETRDERREN